MNKIAGSILIVASAVFFHGRILLEGIRMGSGEREGLITFSNFSAGVCFTVGIVFITLDCLQWAFRPRSDSGAEMTNQAKKELSESTRGTLSKRLD